MPPNRPLQSARATARTPGWNWKANSAASLPLNGRSFGRRGVMQDARLTEIELLTAIDAASFEGSYFNYARPNPNGREQRLREDAIYHLILDGAIVNQHGYRGWGHSPTQPLDTAIMMTQSDLEKGSVSLRITHRGRLRLFRLRAEILNRDRVREPFEILWDMRHWESDLDVHLQFRKNDDPCSIVLLDVDRLKAVNTALTHVGADDVLRGIFRILQAGVVPGEAYRLGGDEAGAILPNIDMDAATAMSERIRETVETEFRDKKIDDQRNTPTVTIAVGTTTKPIEPAKFRAEIDKLLVETKDQRGKRNIVVTKAIE